MMNEVVEKLGWLLVHSLWQFTLVALLAGVARLALKRRSANAHYAACVAAMSLLVAAPVATWCLLPEPAPLMNQPLAAAPEIAIDQPREVTPIEPVDIAAMNGGRDVNNARPNVLEMDWNSPAMPVEQHVVEVEVPLIPVVAPTVERSWFERVEEQLRPWLGWMVAVWCGGVVCFSLRPLLGWRTLRRLRRVGVSPVSEEVLAALQRVSEQLGLKQAVSVLQSAIAEVPVVIGYFKPVILLPVSLATSLSTEQLEAILAHELAHVRRHDFVVNLLQTLIETLFFYHPAVWWLSRQVRIEREHCCDDFVINALGNRVEYGRALVAVEELRGRSSVLALGVNDGSMLSRVRRIVNLGTERVSDERTSSVSIGVMMLGVFFALSITWCFAMRPGSSTRENQSDPMTVTMPNGVQVEFVGLAPMEAEPKTWWKPDGSPLDEVPKYDRGTSKVSEHEMRRVQVRVHGGGLSYLDVTTPGMINVRTDEAHGSGGPFVRCDCAYAFPPGRKTGRIEVGITTKPWSPVRRLDSLLRRIQQGRSANSNSGTQGLIGPQGLIVVDEFETDRPIGVAGGRAERIANNDDFTIDGVERPPLWLTKTNDGVRSETAAQQAVNDQRRAQTRIRWSAPKNWKSFDLEMKLIDEKGHIHDPGSRSVDFDTDEMVARQIQRGAEIFNVPIDRVVGFEYRIRRYQHWVTFDNVALNPGEMTDMKVQVGETPEPTVKLLDRQQQATLIADAVEKFFINANLTYVSREQIADVRSAFWKTAFEATSHDRPASETQQLAHQVQQYLHDKVTRRNGKIPATRNALYLDLPHVVRSLQWLVDSALKRPTLSPQQKQQRDDQYKWIEDVTHSLEKTEATPSPRLKILQAIKRFRADPLSPWQLQPLPEAQWTRFKQRVEQLRELDSNVIKQEGLRTLATNTFLGAVVGSPPSVLTAEMPLPFDDKCCWWVCDLRPYEAGYGVRFQFRSVWAHSGVSVDIRRGYGFKFGTMHSQPMPPTTQPKFRDDDDIIFDERGLTALRGKLAWVDVSGWEEFDRQTADQWRQHVAKNGSDNIRLEQRLDRAAAFLEAFPECGSYRSYFCWSGPDGQLIAGQWDLPVTYGQMPESKTFNANQPSAILHLRMRDSRRSLVESRAKEQETLPGDRLAEPSFDELHRSHWEAYPPVQETRTGRGPR